MGTEGGLVYFLQTGAGGGGSSPIACFQCIETRRTSFWKFLLETSFSRPDLFFETRPLFGNFLLVWCLG